MSKIHSLLVEKPTPIAQDCLNGWACIKLRSERADHQCRLVGRSFRVDLLTWNAWARSWTSIDGTIFGYSFTCIRPTRTSTGSRGAKPISWTTCVSWADAIMSYVFLLGAPLKRVALGRILTLQLCYSKPNANQSVKRHQRSEIGSPEWLISESQLT